MPVCNVTWLGPKPEGPLENTLVSMLGTYIDEDDSEFEIVVNHWETCLRSEKVIICGNFAFMCVVQNDLLVLVPDAALNIPKLIWMMDAERVTVDKLNIRNIRQAMSR